MNALRPAKAGRFSIKKSVGATSVARRPTGAEFADAMHQPGDTRIAPTRL